MNHLEEAKKSIEDVGSTYAEFTIAHALISIAESLEKIVVMSANEGYSKGWLSDSTWDSLMEDK